MGRKAEGNSVALDPPAADTSDPLAGSSPAEPPDLRALRALADASGRELSASRAGWWPELSLYANHVWLGSLHDDDPPGDAWSQGMVYGATASWTLFEGLRTAARTKESAASRSRAATALAAREREVAGALDGAKVRWETARTAWSLESDNAVQAGQVMDAALARYRSGSLSGLDLRRYQDSREQALVGSDEARLELLLARIALRRAAGLDPVP
jgi:outer membrane protein TolC